MAENPGTFGADLDRAPDGPVPVKAGTHTLWATTVLKSHAPRDDLIKPFCGPPSMASTSWAIRRWTG